MQTPSQPLPECIHVYVRLRPENGEKGVIADTANSVFILKTKEHFQFCNAHTYSEGAFSEETSNQEIYRKIGSSLI